MKNNQLLKNRISFALNCIIVVLEVYALISSILKQGLSMTLFYTVDSNIFLMITSGIMAVHMGHLIVADKKSEINSGILYLKYMSVCCVFLTFCVVVAVLSPMRGGLDGYRKMMFEGTFLIHHTICPILAVISYLIFEKKEGISMQKKCIAVIPTFVYAVNLVMLNILHIITGPYPFLCVYRQPVVMSVLWVFIILGMAYGICRLIGRDVKKIN